MEWTSQRYQFLNRLKFSGWVIKEGLVRSRRNTFNIHSYTEHWAPTAMLWPKIYINCIKLLLYFAVHLPDDFERIIVKTLINQRNICQRKVEDDCLYIVQNNARQGTFQTRNGYEEKALSRCHRNDNDIFLRMCAQISIYSYPIHLLPLIFLQAFCHFAFV